MKTLFTTIYFYVANFYANVLVNKCVYISDEEDLAYLLSFIISGTKILVLRLFLNIRNISETAALKMI